MFKFRNCHVFFLKRTTLALLLLENRHDVTIWGPFADYVEEMRQTRRNDRFLKGAELPPALELTADMATAAEAELQDAEAKLKAAGTDLDIDVATIPQMREAVKHHQRPPHATTGHHMPPRVPLSRNESRWM